MADDADGTRWTQVSRVGPGGAASAYGSAAVMCVCGPVMLGSALLGAADLMVMGIVFTVVFLPLGLAFWGNTTVEREHNRRLDAVGVAATAEITELTDWDDGDDVGVTVGLRVSGPGFRTFETTWRRSHHGALRVGLRLTAVVDPYNGIFRVEI
ncbi:hypothetical protein SBI_01504 [Streptomyces bingchenggensis BCW-1]|uniref:Uncharacterized protein n=1 Tax=Streptomyces bingchenggensis (strain BCW-1) TaxID=749414 RepID=D7CDW0_STRBB|nr:MULTISPECIES: hypothetical protein [Streptomyces]ADI04625.1 hypothetical protein SBI_01504 [Streptomyces bingchenggensis BCW-1]